MEALGVLFLITIWTGFTARVWYQNGYDSAIASMKKARVKRK